VVLFQRKTILRDVKVHFKAIFHSV
jgi:hypothetical protein